MNKSEKDKACYIYGLDIPSHLEFLTNLEHDKDDKINDEIDLVLNLLIKKFVAINGPENIASFLENRKLLSENINSRLKNLLKEKHEYKEDLERLNYEQLVPKEFFNYAYFGVLGADVDEGNIHLGLPSSNSQAVRLARRKKYYIIALGVGLVWISYFFIFKIFDRGHRNIFYRLYCLIK